MSRVFCSLILVGVLSTLSSAQDIPDGVAPVDSQTPPSGGSGPMPIQVEPPSQPLMVYDRIMYVLDVSGSMENEIPHAIQVVDVFASDSFKATAVTFTDSYKRWNGVKDERVEPGWALMPKRRPELLAYLRSFNGDGSTDPTEALTYAFKHAPDHTLIVFISDGVFWDKDQEDDAGHIIPGPLTAVKLAQKWRAAHHLAPVQMLVWAPSESDSKRDSLVNLAKLGGGGLWRDKNKPAEIHLPW